MTGPQPVRITSNGAGGTVEVGGIDLSDVLYSVRFSVEAGEAATCELELMVSPAEVAGDALVRARLDDPIRAALIAAGWTPPAGEEP